MVGVLDALGFDELGFDELGFDELGFDESGLDEVAEETLELLLEAVEFWLSVKLKEEVGSNDELLPISLVEFSPDAELSLIDVADGEPMPSPLLAVSAQAVIESNNADTRNMHRNFLKIVFFIENFLSEIYNNRYYLFATKVSVGVTPSSNVKLISSFLIRPNSPFAVLIE